MTHWHVTRHSEDDDPFITDSIYSALDYAARELDELADSEHSYVSFTAERVADHSEHSREPNPVHPGEMEAALRSFAKAERYGNLALNAANMVKQSEAPVAERAPLYADLSHGGNRKADDNPVFALYIAAAHVIGKVNFGSPLHVWDCEAETGEDDERGLYCRMYE